MTQALLTLALLPLSSGFLAAVMSLRDGASMTWGLVRVMWLAALLLLAIVVFPDAGKRAVVVSLGILLTMQCVSWLVRQWWGRNRLS
ncbi:MAG: hypothetical protein H6993_04660 [Pseudomonadales bacterium]|nr:hypothetical protein [Pseudomonadales bacterium]MCP5183230.1 hypothetical protein [Pseudomonadales bacterium]